MNPLCEQELRRGTSALRLGWGGSRAEIAGRKAALWRAQAWAGGRKPVQETARAKGGEKAAIMWVPLTDKRGFEGQHS